MKKLAVSLLAVGMFMFLTGAAQASDYFLWDYAGGTWHDAEKTLSNTDDDLMCWAGTASNMLAWGGWNYGTAYATTDDIFAHFQAHWEDKGSNVYYGLEWWFDGTNNTPSSYNSSWARVDVAGGGGFWNADLFAASYAESFDKSSAMDTVASYLENGMSTGLSITDDFGGHAITVWGYSDDFASIFITDSDNSKNSDNPEDILLEVALLYSDGAWFLQDYYGQDDWYIRGVYGLAKKRHAHSRCDLAARLRPGRSGRSAEKESRLKATGFCNDYGALPDREARRFTIGPFVTRRAFRSFP